jgi:hypothetical protein
MTPLGTKALIAIGFLAVTWPSQAQPSFETVDEMARECITDNLFLTGSCSGYIIGSIDTLESDRRARGGASCLPGQLSKDEVVKKFIRAILANYADKGALPASVLIGSIYRDECVPQN